MPQVFQYKASCLGFKSHSSVAQVELLTVLETGAKVHILACMEAKF